MSDVRWIGSDRNEFELTITFAPEPGRTGDRRRLVRDGYWRDDTRSETRPESNEQNSVPPNHRSVTGSAEGPRGIAQMLCDQMDQGYVNHDLNQVFGFLDSSFVIIDERGKQGTLAELRTYLERMFAVSRHMSPRTIAQDVQLEGDRMVVHYKGEMRFEARDRFGDWIPMISEETGEDTWQRKGDRWKLVRTTIYRDDTHRE